VSDEIVRLREARAAAGLKVNEELARARAFEASAESEGLLNAMRLFLEADKAYSAALVQGREWLLERRQSRQRSTDAARTASHSQDGTP